MDLLPVKSILTKAIIETKTRGLASSLKQDDDSDANWLQAAVIADDDIEMVNMSQISIGFDDDQSGSNSNYDDDLTFGNDDAFEEYEEIERTEAEIDKDLGDDVINSQNKEFIQVLSYDRAFLVKGPVVKIYKNQESREGPHQKLEYVMHLPVFKDSKNNALSPENLLLHNSESNLLFVDKKTNQLINFDLEQGKIIDQIPYK